MRMLRGARVGDAAKSGIRLGLGLGCAGLAVVVAGCAPQEQAAPMAPAVEEIPVTTESQTAKRLFEEGQHLLDVGRLVAAREKFLAAITEDPGFAYAHLNRSNSALSFKEFQEALDDATAALEGKSDGERLLVEINKTFLTNDTDTGLKLAQELVQKYPNSPRAHLALAGIQTARNESPAARRSAQKALELDPKCVAAALAVGTSYLFGEPEDPAQAETYMRKAVELQPDEAKAYEGLGDAKRAQNELQAALEAYTQATDKDPGLAVAQLKKGHVNSFLGNIEEARAAYDAAVESAKPEQKAFYANYRAFTHIHAGEIQAALDELTELAGSVEEMGTPEDQVKGVQVFTLTNHATAALHQGALDQAAKAIEERNALQRRIGEEVGTEDSKRLQEADCLAWEGLLAAYQGNYELATKKAEENAKLLENDQNPRKLEAHHRVLGVAHLLQKNYAEAAEHLRQADHQNTIYVRYQLALAEEGAGNAEEAKKLFKEVAEWNFNSVGFALVRKDAARRAGLEPAEG